MEVVLNEISLTILLGFVALISFWIANLFNNGSNSGNQALNEIKDNKESPRKNTRRVGIDESNGSDKDDIGEQKDLENSRKVSATSLTKQRERFRRTESLKNEHVIFADEITAEDEKFSPHPFADNVHGILHNKEEISAIDPKGGDETRNSFEDIHPLDDLQLIRRKSLQLSPSGSRTSSNRGSRTDLTNLDDSPIEISQEVEEVLRINEEKRVLKFADESVEPRAIEESIEDQNSPPPSPEPLMGIKKVSKMLNKMNMTSEEIDSIIELLIEKEENNEWVNSVNNSSKLTQLRKEVEKKEGQIMEINEVVSSLQDTIKQLRSEFSEEKKVLSQQKQELEAKNQRLVDEINASATTTSNFNE